MTSGSVLNQLIHFFHELAVKVVHLSFESFRVVFFLRRIKLLAEVVVKFDWFWDSRGTEASSDKEG